VSKCRSVIRGVYAIRSFESSKFWNILAIGSSRESLPSSISIRTAVAVIGFDMDAISEDRIHAHERFVLWGRPNPERPSAAQSHASRPP